MNKGLLSFFFLFIALFIGALYYTNTIQRPLISILNNFKSNYHYIVNFIQENIDKHMFQADSITSLKEKLKKYENTHLIMKQMTSEVNDLVKANNSKLTIKPTVELVRSISYQKFGNLNRVWMEINDYNSSKIYGLTYNELVAGIVIEQNSKPLGLLNKDIQSSYAVFIGNEKAPGIAHGNNAKNLIVKFIPAWFKIKKDDEVITSGLDKIFFKGLKVGKVISVTTSQGYQNAIIQPYYKSNEPNYFYIIKDVK